MCFDTGRNDGREDRLLAAVDDERLLRKIDVDPHLIGANLKWRLNPFSVGDEPFLERPIPADAVRKEAPDELSFLRVRQERIARENLRILIVDERLVPVFVADDARRPPGARDEAEGKVEFTPEVDASVLARLDFEERVREEDFSLSISDVAAAFVDAARARDIITPGEEAIDDPRAARLAFDLSFEEGLQFLGFVSLIMAKAADVGEHGFALLIVAREAL